jgi:glucose/arabinose dehydrogenase
MKVIRFVSIALALVLAACGGAEEVAEPAAEADTGAAPQAVLPSGFSATLFASGLPTPRHIAINGNGDVYVSLRSGAAKFRASPEPGGVAALRDADRDGVAELTRMIGRDDTDTGLAIHDGYLYFSSMTDIYAVPLGAEWPPAGEPEVVIANMPRSGGGHRTKAITFDGAGHLYSQVGSPSNACQAEADVTASPGLMPCTQLDEHGGVFRYIANSRNQEHVDNAIRYSRGHRNVVALEWNASAGALYVLMHGRDGLSRLWPEYFTEAEDIMQPAEEFHRVDQGDDLGWPYTYFDPIRGERMVMPEYGGDGETPAEPGRYKDPLIGFPAHWAPDDLVFYEGTQFPERYRHGAFIAFHGPVSPRSAEPGYVVVFVPMDAAGAITGDWEVFAEHLERSSPEAGVLARPAGLGVGPDGALYVVDDAGGRIWKIRYSGD